MFFFQHTDIKTASIWRKIEVHVESNLHFGPPIDVYNHFNAINNTKMRLFMCIQH